MKIENSNVLLTGASGGIGASLLRLLIENGAHVTAVTRKPDSIQLDQQVAHHTVKQLSIIAADINSDEGRRKIIRHVSTYSLKINMLINCAGSNMFSYLHNIPDANIKEMLETNLISPILLTKNLLPFLLENEPAHIVNIGSCFDSIGYPGFSVYNAGKFGLRGFTQALRRELANTDIKVTLVSPRATTTNMNTDKINQLNKELGNKTDKSDHVALQIINAIRASKKEVYLGWPDSLFAKVNRLIPSIVDSVIKKQLPTIQKYL